MTLATLRAIQKNYICELRLAEKKKLSSLSYIINNTPPAPLVKNGELFAALSIGGGITKKALVRNSNGTIEIVHQHTQQQKPFLKKDDFLQTIASLLDPNVSVITINFAQPIQPLIRDNKLDGTFLFGTKERTFRGLIGKQIGQEIERYFLQTKNKKITVAVANDVVCLALAGRTKYAWDALTFGILGTGVNAGFFQDPQHIINLEAGNFNKLPQTNTGKIIDAKSIKPREYIFEKETAGQYLYQHANLLCKKYTIPINFTNTQQLTDAAQGKNQTLARIAKTVLKHSAELIACQIAAITAHKQRNSICLMEGSLFWKGFAYRETVLETVKKLTPYAITIAEIENSPIIGAAKLAC